MADGVNQGETVGLRYKLRRAAAIIDDLTPAEKLILDGHCRAIHRAETGLMDRAEALMARCIAACQGLCCRNAAFDDIIGLADFVYILGRAPHLQARMADCLAAEKPFFTGDCLFLADGRGPCIFSDTLRPEVCITTFCADTTPVRPQIARVKRAFMALNWFLWWRGLKRRARGAGRFLLPSRGRERR